MAAFKVPLLVTAQDRDQPGTENAAVRYTIVDGDPGGNFRYFKIKVLSWSYQRTLSKFHRAHRRLLLY